MVKYASDSITPALLRSAYKTSSDESDSRPNSSLPAVDQNAADKDDNEDSTKSGIVAIDTLCFLISLTSRHPMARIPPVPLCELKYYPRMTSWFRPDLLVKLLWRVVVSDLFGQYADRRLIVAALDTVTPKKLFERTQQFIPKPDDKEQIWAFEKDGDSVWIDYVADLGDGFDATFAVASLLSQDHLEIKGHANPLPRGRLLIMGGDEVYPHAGDEHYRKGLIHPYAWAFPDPRVWTHNLIQ